MSFLSNALFFGIGYYIGTTTKGNNLLEINQQGIKFIGIKVVDNNKEKVEILNIIKIWK